MFFATENASQENIEFPSITRCTLRIPGSTGTVPIFLYLSTGIDWTMWNNFSVHCAVVL